MAGRTRVERETVIVWNEAETEAMVTTCSESTIKLLLKRGYVENTAIPGLRRFFIPKSKISIRAFRKKPPSPAMLARWDAMRGRRLGK